MAVGPSYTLTRLTCDMTSISINMSVWWRISSTPCLKNRQAQRAVQKDVQSYCPEKTRCCSITILMNTVGKTISWVLPFYNVFKDFSCTWIYSKIVKQTVLLFMWNDNKNPKAAPIYKDVGICCLEIVPQLSLSIYSFFYHRKTNPQKSQNYSTFSPHKVTLSDRITEKNVKWKGRDQTPSKLDSNMCYYSKCSTQFTKKGATGQGERGMYSSISCTYYIVSYRKKQKGCTGVSQVQSTKGKRSSKSLLPSFRLFTTS